MDFEDLFRIHERLEQDFIKSLLDEIHFSWDWDA